MSVNDRKMRARRSSDTGARSMLRYQLRLRVQLCNCATVHWLMFIGMVVITVYTGACDNKIAGIAAVLFSLNMHE